MPEPHAAAVPPPNPDTVEAIVETVVRLRDDEESREQSLTGRASGLTGFVGIILSVLGIAGKDAMVGLPAGAKVVALILLLVALGALVTAIFLVVFRVLIPRPYMNIGVDEIRHYPEESFVSQERMQFQGRTMRGMIAALLVERGRNDRKAKALRPAYALVAVGLFAVAADAAIFAMHQVGIY
jgi:hypothetical protein